MNDDKEKGFFDGPPKTMFVFGIASGIAVVALFVVLLGGLELPERDAIAADTAPAVVLNDTPPTQAPPSSAIPELTDEDHVRGDLNKAKVVLVEYSDIECPFCGRHHPTMLDLVDKYGDDVAWVYRHFPLTSIHQNATPAAVAAECAADQGKFWEMTDELVLQQTNLSRATYEATAKKLGLKMGDFTTCLDSGKYEDKISAQQAGGAAAGVTGTPATFVNGQLVSGAVPLAQFEAMIDSLLQ